MQALEKLRHQMDALGNLHNIVKTMKALSAANIRQYEGAVHSLASYFRNVERGLHVVLREQAMSGGKSSPRRRAMPHRLAAVVFGTDYGLCGRFNEEISAYALTRLERTGVQVEDRRILAVGDRVASSLEQAGQTVEEVFVLPSAAAQISDTVHAISLKVDAWQRFRGVQSVYLFYNRHQQSPVGFELWPVELSRFQHLEEQRWPSRSLPTFSMSSDALLGCLLQQYLFVTIFRACAESQASEHASRLSAMQVAQRNLDEHIEELTMQFRRERQNSITSELLDVVAGYEAITGS